MPRRLRRGRPSNIAISLDPEPRLPGLDSKPGMFPSRPPRPSPAQNATAPSRNRPNPISARSSPAVDVDAQKPLKPNIALANETVDIRPYSDDWTQKHPKETPQSQPGLQNRPRLPRPSPPRPAHQERTRPTYDPSHYDWADSYTADSQRYPPPQSFNGFGQPYDHGYGYDYDYNNPGYDCTYDQNVYARKTLPQGLARAYPGHPAFSSQNEPDQPSALPDYSQSQRGDVVNRIPLGLPPSARRGPACYFPEVAPVHPIVEERESVAGSVRISVRNSRGSGNMADLTMLSKHAMGPFAIQEGSLVNNRSVSSIEHPALRGQDSHSPFNRNYGQEDLQETGVVRQASLGKRSRPTLTSVKNGEYPKSPHHGTYLVSDSEVTSTSNDISPLPSVKASLGAKTEQSVHPGERAQRPARTGRSKAWDAPRTFTKPGDVSNPEAATMIDPETAVEQDTAPVRSCSTPSEGVVPYYSVDVERRSSILGDNSSLNDPSAGFSDQSRKPRPRPRPRPLDVAAVREAEARGSLSSLNELIRRATKLAYNLDRGKTASRLGMDWWDNPPADDEKRKSARMSVASMLNDFPPPINKERHSTLASDSDAGKEPPRRRRRVCGMPLWAFVLLVLLVFLLAAAAVVIPVTLLIIPSQKNHNNTRDSTQMVMASCTEQIHCENAGALVIGQNGECKCLCVNGYTGTTCSTSGPTGCIYYTLADGPQASVGQSVAPAFADAKIMDIPLDAAVLSGLFSSFDLSCLAQNALVALADERPPTDSAMFSTTLDFARVAVLYVFQEFRDLDRAVTAQQNLQAFYSSGSGDGRNVTLAGGMTCDLEQRTLRGDGGVVVGRSG